jgi:ABC-2 type transport system ATP-binding protein
MTGKRKDGGMTDGTVIKTSGLTKRFGVGHGITAVKDLDLEIQQGEVFGFLGPNGSGKSTTIGMVLGLIIPTSGSIELFGQDTRQNLPSLLTRVGAVVENSPFYPNLSARDNLVVFARTIGGTKPEHIDELLELVGLTSRAKSKTATFSLGMKQRLGIAIALLNDPELLILDEPTNGLDPSGIIEIRELIQDLGERGKTIFLSSHLLHEVEQVCDHLAIIRKGKVIAQGSTGELLKRGKTLQLRVSDPQAAVTLLRLLDWVASAKIEDDYVVVETGPERAAEVNEMLTHNGIRVSEMKPRESSLEEFFLDAIDKQPGKAG